MPRELNTDQCLALIEELAALGVRDVGLIGGETYLRKDWLDIIRGIRAAGMDCSLQTGGRNMTADRVSAAVDAGIQSIGVSIDGLKETHDFLRGVRGSFDRAVELLANLQRHPIQASVNTQINSLSMPELPTLMEELLSLSVNNWQLALTVAMGNAADRPELIVQPYELLELFPVLSSLHAQAKERGMVLQPSNNIGYFGPYERQLRYVNDEAVHWTGCSAGDNVLGIEANGNVKGCPGLQADYIGGNVQEESLEAIWQRSDNLGIVRDGDRSMLWGYCGECYYAEVCMGGCTWTSHSLLGRPGNNPLCHYRALKFADQGLRERLVKVAGAPGRRFDNGRFEIVVEPVPSAATAATEQYG